MARILLVEDDASTRDMLARALTADGHAVTTAGDGREALDTASATDIDVVVSDISMPEIDGITLVETLLAQREDLPVVLMSALVDELHRAQSLSGQYVRVIGKPVTLEQIRTEVSAALGG